MARRTEHPIYIRPPAFLQRPPVGRSLKKGFVACTVQATTSARGGCGGRGWEGGTIGLAVQSSSPAGQAGRGRAETDTGQ